MNILHTVEFYEPSVGGAQTVVKQLSERLVERGHKVTIATTKIHGRKKIINGVKIKEFDIAGNAVKGFQGEVDYYKDFLRKNRFDIVMNYAAQEWTADLFFEVMDEIHTKKILVPCGYSNLHNPGYRKYYATMPNILRKYDATVYASKTYQDIIFAKKHGVKNIYFIPNGADEREFSRKIDVHFREKVGIPENNLLILTVGSHTGKKGHAEAIKMFSKVGLTQASLLIVGNDVKNGCGKKCALQATMHSLNPINIIKQSQVVVKNLTREEVIAAFQNADVFLFPSQIECSPLVLFEAMASKTPFLTSDVGNAQEIIGWSGGGVILPLKISTAARILKSLAVDQATRSSMANAGYQAWQENFTWENISNQYEELYNTLTHEKH